MFDYLITGFMAIAILILLRGIKRNEKCKQRRFYRTPGGKTILVAYGLVIFIFAARVTRLIIKM